MEVDVEVALLSEVEDPGDLPVAVAVDIGSPADQVGAEVEGLAQAGIAELVALQKRARAA